MLLCKTFFRKECFRLDGWQLQFWTLFDVLWLHYAMVGILPLCEQLLEFCCNNFMHINICNVLYELIHVIALCEKIREGGKR